MSSAARQVLTVPADLAGVRLQDFLARSFPAADRRALRGIQGRGGIKINGMRADRDRRLAAHDYIEVATQEGDLAPRRSPVAAAPIEVLFASPSCLAVDKPAGLPTIPDRSGQDPGVHGRLRELRPDGDLRIAHRLDRDTSGCLLLADGLAAARHFDAVFAERRAQKEYLALVEGCPTSSALTIDRPLGPDPRRPGKVVAGALSRPGFRAAVTQAVVEQRFGRLTLLRVRPLTGRTHQIRVHLASIGLPIAADRDYGGRPLLLSEHKRGYKLRRGVPERPLLTRMFLHSESIRFPDLDGAEVRVVAPLADDLRQALERIAVARGITAEGF